MKRVRKTKKQGLNKSLPKVRLKLKKLKKRTPKLTAGKPKKVLRRRSGSIPLPKEQVEIPEPKIKQEEASFENKMIPAGLFNLNEELPRDYGKDRIVILTRDPRWLYAYWELSGQLAGNLSEAPRILRVYDVSEIAFDGSNAHSFFDLEIPAEADSWYIDTRQPGRSWCVELGIKKDGKFIPFLRSNIVSTPLDGPSGVSDEEWMVPEMTFARLYGMGLGFGQTSPIGAGWQNKIKRELFSGISSPGASLISSPGKRPLKKNAGSFPPA